MAEDRDWIIENLVDNKNLIIPIIGNDMFVYKETEMAKEVVLQQHVVDYFTKKEIIDERKLTSMRNQEYYGMSVLSKSKFFIDNYRKYLKKEYSAGRITLKRSVLDFIKSFKFPIILTTCCFDFLEKELLKEGLVYPSLSYIPQKRNDGDKSDVYLNARMPEKCIYHFFGLAEDGQDWVHNENGLFYFLRSLNSSDYGATGVANYIERNNKRLLALGCNLPDWLFRFLWYPIQKKDNSKTNDEIQGYWLLDEPPSASFEDFLEDINYLSNEEVEDILIEASKKLKLQEKGNIEAIHGENLKANHYDIFLSYASEDRSTIENIYNILHNVQGLSVWFDDRGESEINIGDPYWENIKDGISKSDHYMPIITEAWLEKHFQDSNLKIETNLIYNYYLKNTDNGKQPENLKVNYCLPIVVRGEKFRGQDIIENGLIEQFGENSIIPKELFYKRKSGEYDSVNIDLFKNKDWINII